MITSIFTHTSRLTSNIKQGFLFNYKPNRITSLSPNPAEQEVFVEYKINEGESAYLALTSIDNPNQSHNYILNIEETGQTIDLNNLSVGMYSVAIIVNGQITDSKNLIKE